MKKIANKLILLLFFSLLWSCGFEVLNKSEINNIFFKEIDAFGDRKINFKIKNNLLINSKEDSKNVVVLKLNTDKLKEIKEKNIKNETTKYQITLTTSLELQINENQNDESFKHQISVKGDYLVGDNNSITLNNEKKLTENLIEEISEDILKTITSKINDI
tara:strand:- start:18 stop:500 length:483 start_codon:yes stop_codon:yes gene_type:complete